MSETSSTIRIDVSGTSVLRGNTISEEIYQLNCKYDGELPVEAPEEITEKPEEKKE